jgi:ectoine hydroxylase-related dioxygenase (phytanoyl-CoA dioxygenase family)
MQVSDSIFYGLDEPYSLTATQLEFYQQNQFIKLKQVMEEETLVFFNRCITETVSRLDKANIPMAERSTYGKAFIQQFNLWREQAEIRKLVFSKRLAGIAASLMQVEKVRLYHDQALFKEPGGGITPWHADQYYWPLSTDKTITAWIPLQHTPLEMGPLEFSAGSHKITEGRKLKISDESEEMIRQRLKVTDFMHVVEPFDAGEISFHSGWIFHRAGVNSSEETRKVMTIIYMDQLMTLKEPENENQRTDWKAWCPEATIGDVIDTPLNPVI